MLSLPLGSTFFTYMFYNLLVSDILSLQSVYSVIFFFLEHVCQYWQRVPSSTALSVVSSIFLPIWFCFCLTQIECLRAEDVAPCTNCKAH